MVYLGTASAVEKVVVSYNSLHTVLSLTILFWAFFVKFSDAFKVYEYTYMMFRHFYEEEHFCELLFAFPDSIALS